MKYRLTDIELLIKQQAFGSIFESMSFITLLAVAMVILVILISWSNLERISNPGHVNQRRIYLTLLNWLTCVCSYGKLLPHSSHLGGISEK